MVCFGQDGIGLGWRVYKPVALEKIKTALQSEDWLKPVVEIIFLGKFAVNFS